jgi:hypothetical protein
MSSGQVAPHLEVAINECPSASLNLVAVNAYGDKPPSTEAYRSQQFIDITDELEGPPPYQDGVAGTFMLIRDSHHQLSSNATGILGLCDGFLHLEAGQSTITGDFVLFQDGVSWADNAGDFSSIDASSSQVSCCSTVSVCSSIESSAATSASATSVSAASAPAFAEHQRSVLEEPLQLDTDEAYDKTKQVDTSRLIHWLQNVVSSSKESTTSLSIPSAQAINSAPRCAKKDPDSHGERCSFRF